MQYLLGPADWEADVLCNAGRTSLIQHPGAPEAELVSDETGSLEEGHQAAGVARQQSGTAGRIENCQLGILLTYTARLGHAMDMLRPAEPLHHVGAAVL